MIRDLNLFLIFFRYASRSPPATTIPADASKITRSIHDTLELSAIIIFCMNQKNKMIHPCKGERQFSAPVPKIILIKHSSNLNMKMSGMTETQSPRLGPMLAIPILILTALIVAVLFSIWQYTGEKGVDATGSSVLEGKTHQGKEDSILLKAGIFSFWLICLTLVLIGIFKIVELIIQY